ncbi:MAG: RsmF rRNA methyltransferase first C-terminal domain-containing protein [Firmicutes bacterium]|nr:RsmF rRNA methyltransferase first C-terminal domain-containing protein [Bacillota bacterium]
MNLPKLFIERIEHQLGQHNLPLFVAAMNQKPIHAIRIHKAFSPLFQSLSLKQVPWHESGFYIDDAVINGQHPYHHAGAFYFQEASAMAVVPMLDIQPNDLVLDIAAAPGSKYTDIASRLGPQGFLIANDIDARRAQTLMFNIERLGLSQAIVTQHDPHHLPTLFPHFFDKILVDAPCSGEGMFRKDPAAVSAWSVEHVQTCATRQAYLLEDAVKLLKPGGRIVYSTCTFAPEENELLIRKFLETHPAFRLINHHLHHQFDAKTTQGVGVKLWPHLIRGEGHYVVVLQHQGAPSKPIKFTHRMKNPMPPAWIRFAEETLSNQDFQPNFALDERLFQIPISYQYHSALHTLRAGVYVGDIEKNIFYPSHHLAHNLRIQDVKQNLNLTLDDSRLNRYLQGEEILADIEKGWILISVDGLPLGWGKASQGRIKNHYPKALRLLNTRK